MIHLVVKTIRFIFYFLDLAIMIFVAFLCSFLPQSITKHFMHGFFRKMCWGFIRLIGNNHHIHEKFKPPLPERYILISNHPSGYDILMLNALFTSYPLAKYEVQKWWFLGRIARAVGTLFVKREEKNSRTAAKQACIEGIKQGKNILIYPEGGCFGKHLREFKYGAFDISLATGVPILPVYLQYEAENAFEWGDYGLIQHLINMIGAVNKNAHCYIFDPVYPEGFKDAASFAQYVHKLYQGWEKQYRLPHYESTAHIPFPVGQSCMVPTPGQEKVVEQKSSPQATEKTYSDVLVKPCIEGMEKS